ncbi:MAG: hypothetical protein DLM63_05985 [Solirubrobacterales bacterium]|nr:MAG: hypothetical protein DLM63_05985 [Solirubrobacterales bacterium]
MAGPLLVVDTPSLLYRSFFALPETITDADGMPVNALLGAVNRLLLVIAAERPRAVVHCFGPDAAPYRVRLYPAYHAKRPAMPAGLRRQWDIAADFFNAFGWYVTDHAEVEADDLLFSYGLAEATAGGHALLLTGDRDLYGAVRDGVSVLYLKTGADGPEPVDANEVRRRYGVDPALVAQFIALRGDPSDGLPGAPGIGAKTAADLLRRHGSIEQAIARSLRERPRVGAALREHADELRAFVEIATLQEVAVELPADRETNRAGGAAAARARGMERLAKRLEAG